MQFGFGSGLLWGLRTDVTPATPIRFGALQDVQIDFKGEVKMLYGQFQFPIDVARGKVQITGKAKFAEINAQTYNNLFFGQTLATGQTLTTYNVPGTVPASTPWTVTPVVPNTGVFKNDMGVRYVATGQPFERVAAPTTAGQYSVNETTGVYTFDTADANAAVYFDFSYTVTSGYNIAIGNALMGATPRFKAVFSDTFEGNTLTCILNQCVSTDLSLPTKVDDYTVSDFSFSAFADASNNVGNLSMGVGAAGN